jgi:hypothetical protein
MKGPSISAKGNIAKAQTKVWALEACPACSSKDLSTNYFSGEVFCLKCGLVIY